jgi:hypothetical protein
MGDNVQGRKRGNLTSSVHRVASDAYLDTVVAKANHHTNAQQQTQTCIMGRQATSVGRRPSHGERLTNTRQQTSKHIVLEWGAPPRHLACACSQRSTTSRLACVRQLML